jgi:hypothetical protein
MKPTNSKLRIKIKMPEKKRLSSTRTMIKIKRELHELRRWSAIQTLHLKQANSVKEERPGISNPRLQHVCAKPYQSRLYRVYHQDTLQYTTTTRKRG